ncbi:D-alanyl-D-alanine carboxypeptidase [Aquirufa rosea]|uniref:D-alanyl-D-alanine carboxypeptidase/D-alanyl-D-alanine-endopeptidase n=1 Tax=Aquirufa rosea TaxID=2509241 RepID=A0A4Q1C115_9BACT|nr:D-alanyl-D-alanine carboxypeptidase [Aquirufa rosea]RXK50796.1 hypothetical protein ESB04_03865 [Aquirufa rosea]
MRHISPVYFLFLSLSLLISSCQSMRLKRAFVQSGLNQFHTGVLIQSSTGKVVFSEQADKYFMPASNVKLLTLLVAKSILPDSVPSFQYQEKGDSLYFWGTGDPSTLHEKLKNVALWNFLQQSNKNLVYADNPQHVLPQGAGWAWDDYQDYYAAETTTLPLFGNLAHFTNTGKSWKVIPSNFQNSIQMTADKEASRERNANQFRLPKAQLSSSPTRITIPFLTSPALTAQILSDTLHKKVNYRSAKPDPNLVKTIYSSKLDSLLVPLLHFSDNMVGEQLIYLIGAQKGWNGPTNQIISRLTQEPGFEFLKELKWVDGSGLSRYNLFRPKDMVFILQKLQEKLSDSQWKFLLPELGRSGTLKSMKLTNPISRAWAKSGSFGNTYNLTGYYKNSRGKLYLFSIMTNLANQSVAINKKQILEFLNSLN